MLVAKFPYQWHRVTQHSLSTKQTVSANQEKKGAVPAAPSALKLACSPRLRKRRTHSWNLATNWGWQMIEEQLGMDNRGPVETGSLSAAGVRGSCCLLSPTRMRLVAINMTQVTEKLLSEYFSVRVRYCCPPHHWLTERGIKNRLGHRSWNEFRSI